MMKILLILGVFAGQLACANAGQAAKLEWLRPVMELAQQANTYPVAPSQAAVIAKESVPGSKVLNVKLLPSGVYAVTLKVGGSVTRVMVDATSGAIS